MGPSVGVIPVGDGDGAGESVGLTEGNGRVGVLDGVGVGPGDSVGVSEGLVGNGEAVGLPKVGFGVGLRELVGEMEGVGVGSGESVGVDDGNLSVGV